MIQDFDDFCLYVYVIVDDIYQSLRPLLGRPGPAPVFSDSELLAVCLVGECKGWDKETELLSNMAAHRELFPQLPGQSRFNRRRRNLMQAMNLLVRCSAVNSLCGISHSFHPFVTRHDLRQWRRQDAGALVVVALAGKLLAFHQHHVDVSAGMAGKALERKAARGSGGSAADDDDPPVVGQLA